ncbi:hypothetical protein [Actinacidiphila acididurans]|nr:hypothetical protein [Actinacidiphila acididurans]
MLGLEVVVLLGLTLLAAHVPTDRFRIAPPVLLLLTGVLFGFIPT